MRAEFASLNDCEVSFLSRAAVKLRCHNNHNRPCSSVYTFLGSTVKKGIIVVPAQIGSGAA